MSGEALLAGMAAIAALGVEEMPKVKSTEKHAAINGHICGHDMGKDVRKCQPRNSPCACGSGKKSKKCCVTLVTPYTNEQNNSSGECGAVES